MSKWKLIEEPFRIAVETDTDLIADVYLADEEHPSEHEEQAMAAVALARGRN